MSVWKFTSEVYLSDGFSTYVTTWLEKDVDVTLWVVVDEIVIPVSEIMSSIPVESTLIVKEVDVKWGWATKDSGVNIDMYPLFSFVPKAKTL